MSTNVDAWAPSPDEITEVQSIVDGAIRDRLLEPMPDAVLEVTARGGRIRVVVNSGGNHLAAARRLEMRDWVCESDNEQPAYGCSFLVRRARRPR